MYAVLIGLFLISVTHANPLDHLPRMGDETRIYLTESQERLIARQMRRHFSEKQLILEDVLLNYYLQSLGERLIAATDSSEFDPHFFWINSSEINAFAAPAAHIAIHVGLLLFTESEAEFAGVLAHEIAHVNRRHIGRLFSDSQRMAIPTMVAMIAGAALAASVGGEGSGAAIAGVAGASAQRRLSYSRAFEQEADRLGRTILQNAGFGQEGLTQFLMRLQQQMRSGNRPPEYLLTHPHLERRVGDSQDFTDRLSPLNHTESESSQTYELMKMRARVLTATSRLGLLKILQQPPNSIVKSYGQLLLFTHMGEFSQANQQLAFIKTRVPMQLIFLLAAAELAEAQKNFSESEAVYRQSHALYGNDQRLLVQQARMWVSRGEGQIALDILQPLSITRQIDRLSWQTIAQAAELSQSSGRLHEAMAEFHYLSGDLDRAIQHLEAGLRRDDLGFFYQARLKSRLLEFSSEKQASN